MPPGSAYNWYCVLSATADILCHAAKHRTNQLYKPRPLKSNSVTPSWSQSRPDAPKEPVVENDNTLESTVKEYKPDNERQNDNLGTSPNVNIQKDSKVTISNVQPVSNIRPAEDIPKQEPTPKASPIEPIVVKEDVVPAEIVFKSRNLQSSKVPSSRLGRLFHYGGLAASLGYGAASEVLRRTSGSEESSSSLMLTEANVKRLVSKLSQMRGAALKLGQFLSIQDTHVLPPEVDKIFRRVQDSAHYMPDWQMQGVLDRSLGPGWNKYFTSFNRIPFASASIGQVHSAYLAAEYSPTGKPIQVAVKIQFPNIASSISSDLSYVNLLLTAGRVLPRGLFLDKTMSVMKEELADECNYAREAEFARKFGNPEFLGGHPRFKVPWVWDGSTKDVLVMEMVEGLSVGELETASQEDRNEVANLIITLCMKELFHFRTMQTDPNWSNFLWNPVTRQVNLIDFGATREYSEAFIDTWFLLLQAAANDDREACIRWSLDVGYLTGEENETMLNAHVTSMALLATPFKSTTVQPFEFGGPEWQASTRRIREFIPIMLRERLTPPPRETYSLNRKLSGAFLLASKLGAKVDTRKIWDDVTESYRSKFTTSAS